MTRFRTLAALFLPLVLQAQGSVNPRINKLTDINLGSLVPGPSAGTATLQAPAGTRSVTGGTSLGPASGVSLGSLTLTGRAGNGWSVSAGSAIPFTLTGSAGGSLQATAVYFEPSASNSGTFPPGGTTGVYYLGVTVSVGTAATTPAGLYLGSFTLRVTDTTTGRTGTTTFAVRATVVQALALTRLADLRFGDLYAGLAPGTVTLSPAGTRTAGGGAGLGTASAFGSASFQVSGAPGATYSIVLPAAVTLSGPGGATLGLTGFTSSPAGAGALDLFGRQTLAVGGTLQLGANQAEGDYTGTFSVTVAYN